MGKDWSMSRTKIARGLRASFKELARSIIAKDRAARKYGHSQNTIGSIERALVKAYTMGLEAGASTDLAKSEGKTGIIDWIEIPPRARDTLQLMTFGFSHLMASHQVEPAQIERFIDDSRYRWRLTGDRERSDAHTFSDGAVTPLIRMGLLAPVAGEEYVFNLTDMGIATCREYWRRSDANDPTLPIMSLR